METGVGGLPSNVREMYYMNMGRFFFNLTQFLHVN